MPIIDNCFIPGRAEQNRVIYELKVSNISQIPSNLSKVLFASSSKIMVLNPISQKFLSCCICINTSSLPTSTLPCSIFDITTVKILDKSLMVTLLERINSLQNKHLNTSNVTFTYCQGVCLLPRDMATPKGYAHCQGVCPMVISIQKNVYLYNMVFFQ